MKLRLDLVLAAVLVATAGSEMVAPDAFSAQAGLEQERACRSNDAGGATRLEATERILAQGYSEVSQLAKGCDNVWRALAFAEGDPVIVLVTPRGDVLIE
ncbi:MAG TPA: hypothetical protein VJ790_05165 [Dongiaceae bacterium]|nr:hypothetical protein [Dongiaceae bacterium]